MFKNGHALKSILGIVLIVIGLLISYMIIPMSSRVNHNSEMILENKEFAMKERVELTIAINTTTIRYEAILDRLNKIDAKLDKIKD